MLRDAVPIFPGLSCTDDASPNILFASRKDLFWPSNGSRTVSRFRREMHPDASGKPFCKIQ